MLEPAVVPHCPPGVALVVSQERVLAQAHVAFSLQVERAHGFVESEHCGTQLCQYIKDEFFCCEALTQEHTHLRRV